MSGLPARARGSTMKGPGEELYRDVRKLLGNNRSGLFRLKLGDPLVPTERDGPRFFNVEKVEFIIMAQFIQELMKKEVIRDV